MKLNELRVSKIELINGEVKRNLLFSHQVRKFSKTLRQISRRQNTFARYFYGRVHYINKTFLVSI